MTQTLYFSKVGNDTYGYLGGLGDAGKVAAGVSTGASVAASLIAAGVGAQAVPVVGNILGAVAILAGGIALAINKRKAGQSSVASVEAQQTEVRNQIAQLDQLIAQAEAKKTAILNDISRLGLSLSGLGSLKSWWKTTVLPVVAPKKYYANATTSANNVLATLQTQLDTKIAYAKSLQAELENLQAQLVMGQAAGLPSVINNLFPDSVSPTAKKVIVYGSGAVALSTVLYFLFKK